MFNRESRDLIRKLAEEAGFCYDISGCNILTPDEGMWINKEIWKFTELILKNAYSIGYEDDGN